MPVPYSICTKIQKARNILENKGKHRENNKEIVLTKGSGNIRGAGMSRPYTYVDMYTTKFECSAIYGILKRKKKFNDF